MVFGWDNHYSGCIYTDAGNSHFVKQPNDIVFITIIRDGVENIISVTLTKLETYKLNYIGLEIKESDAEELKLFGVNHGVKIRQVLNKNLKI